MKRILIVFILLLNFSSSFSQISLMSEIEFTNKYSKELQVNFPYIKYSIIDSLGISADLGNQKIIHSLDNAYIEYSSDPENLDEIIHKYINSTREVYDQNIGIKINRIIPIVKSIHYFEESSRPNQILDKNTFVYDQYNDSLIIIYVEDKESSISYLKREEFDKLGISNDTLLNYSVDNLNQIMPQMERHGENGVYMLVAGGNYEVSLILKADIWNKENFPIKGNIVIAIPNRDMLLISGSDDKKGIKKLKKISSKLFNNGSYQITESLFEWNGEKFILFKK